MRYTSGSALPYSCTPQVLLAAGSVNILLPNHEDLDPFCTDSVCAPPALVAPVVGASTSCMPLGGFGTRPWCWFVGGAYWPLATVSES